MPLDCFIPFIHSRIHGVDMVIWTLFGSRSAHQFCNFWCKFSMTNFGSLRFNLEEVWKKAMWNSSHVCFHALDFGLTLLLILLDISKKKCRHVHLCDGWVKPATVTFFYQCNLHLTNRTLTLYNIVFWRALQLGCLLFHVYCAETLPLMRMSGWRVKISTAASRQKMLSKLLFTIYYVLENKHTKQQQKILRIFLFGYVWRSVFVLALYWLELCSFISLLFPATFYLSVTQ